MGLVCNRGGSMLDSAVHSVEGTLWEIPHHPARSGIYGVSASIYPECPVFNRARLVLVDAHHFDWGFGISVWLIYSRSRHSKPLPALACRDSSRSSCDWVDAVQLAVHGFLQHPFIDFVCTVGRLWHRCFAAKFQISFQAGSLWCYGVLCGLHNYFCGSVPAGSHPEARHADDV